MPRRAALTLALLLLPATVTAWWNAEWSQRKPIALNTTPTGVALSAPLSDVPVLLRLHAGNFPQFLSVKDGGADLRFVAGDDQTPLKYHVERFDAAAQMAMIWTKLPAVAANDTTQTFYLYFANPAAPRGADAAATFDADTTAVFHFAEPGGMPTDSTAYGTTVAAGEWFPNPASLIGSGALLSGTAALRIADAPHLAVDPAKGWTATLWLRFEQPPADGTYVLDREGEGARVSLSFRDGSLVAAYGEASVVATVPVTDGQWHQLALVLEPVAMKLYVDGAPAGEAPITLEAATGPIYLGGAADGSGTATMALDELQLSGVARPADYLAFGAAVQGERNDTVLTYSADEAAGQTAAAEGGHAGHFGIIIQNVFGRPEAIVEQIVIGVCVLMAAIAIMVMFLKAVYLSRCRRDTNAFEEAYAETTASGAEGALMSLAERDEDFGDSPLYAVYESGVNQLRGRMSPAVGAQAVALDSKALETLRATLDAVMVRQRQRLNGMLVLLTIAISGGPFIGLLGTVVGVMVTFAAIAATGDVNIAAIAPGMAAALLATVAGLGVAIPALFGYNYLSAKAKEQAADMQVFADEFMARVNEQYGA